MKESSENLELKLSKDRLYCSSIEESEDAVACDENSGGEESENEM